MTNGTSYSGQAAFVPQSTFLFDDTVRDNVTLGGEWDDDEVWAALRAAAAEDFVTALPEGLDTVVGTGGYPLTPAQSQQLALARLVPGGRLPGDLVFTRGARGFVPKAELSGARMQELLAA